MNISLRAGAHYVSRQLERPDDLGVLFRTAATAVLLVVGIGASYGLVASGFHLFFGAPAPQQPHMPDLRAALVCGLVGGGFGMERCVRGLAILDEKCKIAFTKALSNWSEPS